MLHFPPDGKWPLLPSIDTRLQSPRCQQRAECIGNLVKHITALLVQIVQPFKQQVAGIRIDFTEGKVFQLLTKCLHTHATGERRKNIQCFLRNALAFVIRFYEMQCPHIVQTVGQLNQQNANIIGGGKQQFAEVFGLRRVLRRHFKF